MGRSRARVWPNDDEMTRRHQVTEGIRGEPGGRKWGCRDFSYERHLGKAILLMCAFVRIVCDVTGRS